MVEVTISLPPRVTWVLSLSPSILGSAGLEDSRKKGRWKGMARRGERKKEEILVPRYRRGPRPCRLFVIVICITMDETRVMGSWDLLGEHDVAVGEKGTLSVFGTPSKWHASAFYQCSRYRRSHCNNMCAVKKIFNKQFAVLTPAFSYYLIRLRVTDAQFHK